MMSPSCQIVSSTVPGTLTRLPLLEKLNMHLDTIPAKVDAAAEDTMLTEIFMILTNKNSPRSI